MIAVKMTGVGVGFGLGFCFFFFLLLTVVSPLALTFVTCKLTVAELFPVAIVTWLEEGLSV